MEKTQRGFQSIHYIGKNCEKHNWPENVSKTNKDGCLRAKEGTCQFQFGELFQFANTLIHQFQDINGLIDSKNLVYILSWNQGNHIMGHLWIQADHHLDHKCSDYDQPVTINMYDQTMISLESCSIYYGWVWSICFCIVGQPGFAQKKTDSSMLRIM